MMSTIQACASEAIDAPAVAGEDERAAAIAAVRSYLRAGGLRNERHLATQSRRIVDAACARLAAAAGTADAATLRDESLREAIARVSAWVLEPAARHTSHAIDARNRAIPSPVPRAVPRSMAAQPTPALASWLRASSWLVSLEWRRPRSAYRWQAVELESQR
jgi:hypothetical protein